MRPKPRCIDHLIELRKRLIYCVIGFVLAFIAELLRSRPPISQLS